MRSWKHPARMVPVAFMLAIAVGTALLMLPVARQGDDTAPLTVLFTATSAVCVNGLITVDTATYWSPFGQVVIMALVQAGGFGIMTMASLLGLVVAGRLRLRDRLVAQAETKAFGMGDIRSLVWRVLAITVSTEIMLASVLTVRFWWSYGYDAGAAAWYGVFHAISAFNNAGFALYSDSLESFVTDPVITMPICVAVIIGGIGFPVVYEIAKKTFQPTEWSVHTKITVIGTVILIAIGFTAYLVLEWYNPHTLGRLSVMDKVEAALFSGIMPRTAGFNSLAIGELNTQTLAVTDVLMFIGGGSSGTAGGIKITTFFLLALVIWSEIRGEPDVSIFRRSLNFALQRQALTVALLGVGTVAVSTLCLMIATDYPLDDLAFESASAFGTAGLSTGITADLPVFGQLILIGEMFTGRVGPIALGAALAMRIQQRRYRYPNAHIVIG